jgi:hypothetical protein
MPGWCNSNTGDFESSILGANPSPGTNMSEKKKQQLGIPIGTATNRLVKMLLYDFAKKLDRVTCYRCSKHITLDDMSIDHKKPWLNSANPVALFFDLENIALSHKNCNSDAGRRGRRIVDQDGRIRCYKCQRFLEACQFYKNKSKQFGLSDECKACDNKRPTRKKR